MIVGIITVPSRSISVGEMVTSLIDSGVTDIRIFNDVDYRGHKWNYLNMLEQMCGLDDDVMLCMDDVEFKDGWMDEVSKYDYDVLSLFTNRNLKLEQGVYDGTGKHVLYDVAVVYRKGFLNDTYMKELYHYMEQDHRTERELKHMDVMHSHFLRDRGSKVGVIRPNLVKHKDIPSTLGHKVKVG